MKVFLRQFSHAPRPKPGQSFASYIETLAAGHLPPLDILTLLYEIGLTAEDHVRALPFAYGLTLTDGQVQNMAYVLRLPEERIREMLLTHYDGVACDLQPMDVTNALAVHQNAIHFTTPRLCPCCITEDAYFRLAHRLPWMFLCSTHQVLLAHTCPGCSRPFGNIVRSRGTMPSYPADVPDPSTCRNPPARGQADFGRRARPCGHPFRNLIPYDVSAFPRVLATQAHIEQVLERHEGAVLGKSMTSVAYFQHLHSLLALLDYAAEPAYLGAGLPPLALETARQHAREREHLNNRNTRQRARTTLRTPEWMCAFLPTAVDLLALPNEATLANAFIPLLKRARQFKQTGFRALGRYFKFTGPLLRAFDMALIPQASPRRRTGHTSPYSHHPDQPYGYLPNHLPQLLWTQTYHQDFAKLFVGSTIAERHIRSFIAMDLVRLCGKYGWVEAAHELGFLPGQAVGSANTAIGVLNSLGNYETYLTRLHATAARLETVERPLDFGRRRREHRNLVEFPLHDWRLEMRAHDLHPGKPGGKHRWAATHAWALLTAGHPRRAPAFQRLNDRERDCQLDIYYRFNRDHLMATMPALRRLTAIYNESDCFAGEAELGAQEDL